MPRDKLARSQFYRQTGLSVGSPNGVTRINAEIVRTEICFPDAGESRILITSGTGGILHCA